MKESEGWVLAMVGGSWVVGKRATTIVFSGIRSLDDALPPLLSPVYDFQVQVQQGPNGQAGIRHTAFPLAFMPSLSSMQLPASAVVYEVASLSDADQKTIMAAVTDGERIAQQIRASQSGIAIAPASAIAQTSRTRQ